MRCQWCRSWSATSILFSHIPHQIPGALQQQMSNVLWILIKNMWLANQFNNSLLSSKEPDIIAPEEHDPDTSDDEPSQKITSDCDPESYGSDLWNEKVDTSLESFNVPQPRLPTESVKNSQTELPPTATNTHNCTTCENTNDQSSPPAKPPLLVQLTQYKLEAMSSSSSCIVF